MELQGQVEALMNHPAFQEVLEAAHETGKSLEVARDRVWEMVGAICVSCRVSVQVEVSRNWLVSLTVTHEERCPVWQAADEAERRAAAARFN